MTSKPSPTMPCFTCGKETTTRCPSCAKVGMELAFCSREHQVLAWPVHSKLCGKVDFEWPKISSDELEHLKAIAHEKRSDDLMDQSIADSFKRLLPQVPVERILNDLARSPCPLPSALQAPLLASARSTELGHYEAALEDSTASGSPPPKLYLPLPLLRATNLAFNLYTVFTTKPGLWTAQPELSQWWTPLHSRIIHLTTVHYIMCNAGEDKTLLDETEAWYVLIEKDLRDFLATVGLSEAETQDAVGDYLEAPTNV